MFRRPELLRRDHPTYRMIAAPVEELQARAQRLAKAIADAAPQVATEISPSTAYLGSGSLPTEAIPSVQVTVAVPSLNATEMARRLRTDDACVFGRIEHEAVRLDLRTVRDEELPAIAAAIGRVVQSGSVGP